MISIKDIFVFRCTGYLAMKVGKVAAVAAGGGILLLQFASHKGYININWDKVCRQVDKASDKIEKEATGKGPGFMDKVLYGISNISLTLHP